MKDQTIEGFVIITDPQPGDAEGYRRHAFGHTLDDAIGFYNDNHLGIGLVGVSRALQNGYGIPLTIIVKDGILSAHIGDIEVVEPEEDPDKDDEDEVAA